MSNDTINPNNLPDADDIETGGGGTTWRVARGMFVHGQEIVKDTIIDGKTIRVDTGTYPAQRTKIAGTLERVGLFDAMTDKWGYKKRLEIDVMTKDGMVHLAANLLGRDGNLKITASAAGLARGVLLFKKGELLCIETRLGEKGTDDKGNPIEAPTWVNWFSLDPETFKATERRPEKVGGNGDRSTWTEKWATLDIEGQLRKHDAYQEREAKSGGPTHLSELNKELQSRGWPLTDHAPEEWLQLMAKLFKEPKPRASIASWSDDDWGVVRQQVQSAKAMPQMLEAAKARLAAAPADASDPFAEEDPFAKL